MADSSRTSTHIVPQTAGAQPRVLFKRSQSRRIVCGFLLALAGCSAFRSEAAEPLKRLMGVVRARQPVKEEPPAADDASPDGSKVVPASSEEPLPPRPAVRYTDGRAKTERAAKTLGGVQFWADELWYDNWRIQRHAITGHCRLLDPDNCRQDWGTFEQCEERFQELKQEHHLPPLARRVVILLHGLGGWHTTMQPLADYLEENGQLQAINLTYPSTRADVTAHARQLTSVIEHLQGVEEINFVAHSLGNIVLRRYLAEQTDAAHDRFPDPRIKRIVMLAPPNHGSEKAEKWSERELFVAVMGASAMQLGTGWSGLEKKLAVPQCEFGIIAGGRGDDRGYSSRLAGDDDNTISVETTRLPGARDFAVVPVWHSFMIFSPTVQRYTLQFLERGYFSTESQRKPIPAEPAEIPAEPAGESK